MIQSLAGKLAANPRNPDGWIMLMRSYATIGRKSEASAALVKAKAANPQAATDLDAAARYAWNFLTLGALQHHND